jgi:hypothetical protein
MDVDGRIPSMELEKQTHLLQGPTQWGEPDSLSSHGRVRVRARFVRLAVSRDSKAGDAFSRSRTRAPIVVGLHVAVRRARVRSTSRSAQRRAEARGTRNVLWPSSAL